MGRVVKGINFVSLKDAGDPVELSEAYERQGADELIFLDITASSGERDILIDVVRKAADTVFIPLTVGGGIRSVKDAEKLLRAGADKVAVNSAAIADPTLISDIAYKFGNQCVVVAIDVSKKLDQAGEVIFEVYTHGGRHGTGQDVRQWATKAQELGAGELLITSMDKDGTKDGYDLELLSLIHEITNLPVIASGGAGKLEHMLEAVQTAHADALLAASIFHFGEISIKEVKDYLTANGLSVRPIPV
jgi:cyclase